MKKRCKKCYAIYDVNDKACPSCGKKGYSVINETKSDTSAGLAAAGIMIVIALIIFGLVSCSSDGNYTDEELEEAGRWRECSERTNTYYKCSWSHSEDRCVCKQR